ncbi:MAG: hypothetical protein ACR65Z_12475 [Methylocystis sp.]
MILKDNTQFSLDALDFLDGSPDELDRPIKHIGGKTYLATWVRAPGHDRAFTALCVVCDDGEAFADETLPGFKPLSSLPFPVNLPHEVAPDKRLSGSGLKKFLTGHRPKADVVFKALREGIDSFVSFEGSTSDQRTCSDVLAAWAMGTYFLEAFDVVGYPWPTGERGSGKTQLLNSLAAVSYMGRTVTAGSTFASVRDEAHYGATLCFDDCENVKEMEPSKRELLLAGNTRGAQISVKESVGEGQWKTRYVNCFSGRCFSSINLPDPVLASRTISIPLVASPDNSKTRLSPSRKEDWPFDVGELTDDLWLLALTNLGAVRAFDAEASCLSPLQGRNHDIFRMPLAIAWWLMANFEMGDVHKRVESFAENYQLLRSDEQGVDSIAIALLAIGELIDESGRPSVVVSTEEILRKMRGIELREGSDALAEMTPQRTGMLLSRLGFAKGQGHGFKRSWVLKRNALERQAKARGLTIPVAKAKLLMPPVGPDDAVV